jgi:hypothetical protein
MSEPHAITKLCNIGPCTNVPIDRKHQYQYHSTVVLMVKGKKVTVTRSGNGGLECPAVGCDVVINRRTTYQSHMDKRVSSSVYTSSVIKPMFLLQTQVKLPCWRYQNDASVKIIPGVCTAISPVASFIQHVGI